MNRPIRSAGCWLPAIWIAALAFTLTGCVTPQVETQPGAKLESYRKVYLIESSEDPRQVEPRVCSRLEQAGFQVVAVQPDSPPTDIQGSGFLVTTNGHLLTCAHIVGSQARATAWINGRRFVCRVLACDTNLDLALLLTEPEHPPFRPLQLESGTNYRMGEEAFSLGFPLADILGFSPRLNKGMISATVGMGDDPKSIQFSAPVQPGDSGGPLLNSKSEVIGVITSTLNPMKVLVRSGGKLPQNVNFAIKTGPIREFLATAKIAASSPSDEKRSMTFDEAQESLGLVRAGEVTEEELKQPTLICVCRYISFWDMWYRFRAVEIRFYDGQNGDLVLKVGQYRDDPFSNEDAELNHLFAEISDRFFPDQPNPFRSGKSPSATSGK